MSRVPLSAIACLVLLPVEAALLRFAPWLGGARADLCLCAVAWLALSEVGTVEGAVGAYLCGTLADLFYSVHPGLFALLAVPLFLLARFGPIDARSRGELALLTVALSLAQALLARGILALAGQPLPEHGGGAVLGGALLTGLALFPFSLLLDLAASAFEREDPSLLR